MMEYVTLGPQGPTVSRVGFGGWAVGGHGYGSVDDDASVTAIHAALDAGITLFDTADVYGFGHSERLLGKALRGRADQAVLVSKFGVRWNESGRTFRDSSAGVVRSCLEGSLRRLGVEQIHVYLVHWWDGRSSILDTLEELERCRDEGLIGQVGISNIPPPPVETVLGPGKASVVQIGRGLDLRCDDADLWSRVRDVNAGTMAFGVLGRGLLGGRINAGQTFDETDTRSRDPAFSGEPLRNRMALVEALTEVGNRVGRTPAQVATRWVLDEGLVDCAVLGMKTADQVRENAGAAGWSLDPADATRLDALSREVVEADGRRLRTSRHGDD